MLENEFPDRRPLSSELHAGARRARSRAVASAIYQIARPVAVRLRLLARATDRLARDLLWEAYQRGAVRALQRLDDGTLADIGVSRGEIESAVHNGRSAHAIRKIEYRHQNWRRFPPQSQAALRQKLPRPRPPEMMEPTS